MKRIGMTVGLLIAYPFLMLLLLCEAVFLGTVGIALKIVDVWTSNER